MNFLTGHSWGHMWYLYMVIGLYLITPVIKPFVARATDKDLMAALVLLFIMSSLFPTLNHLGVGITPWMIITPPFIFIYMLGYWLCWKAPRKIVDNKLALAIVTLSCLAIIVVKCYHDLSFDYFGQADMVRICWGATVFLWFRSFDVNWRLANRLVPYCFGIYLMHPVFINFTYKYLNVETEMVTPVLNFFGFFLLFTLLSFISTFVLMKIPFMKKHVL